MIKKVTLRIAVFFLATYKFAISQTGDLAKAQEEFVKLRSRFEEGPGDILFLMDTTGSLSNYGFHSEKQFIDNFLRMITVTNEAVRVELIPFDSTEVSSYIDQVSNPTSAMEKCTFTEKLNRWQHSYGWMTNTKGAFQLAEDVCLGKRSGNKRSVKTVVILITDGYWMSLSGDSSPVPIAQKLQAANVEVYAIGIDGASKWQLLQLSQQAFYLETFTQLRELAYYVRGDPMPKFQPVASDKCPWACDPIAKCSCNLMEGDYSCQCPEGHVGSGTVGNCFRNPGKK